jgi:hypothetical protein
MKSVFSIILSSFIGGMTGFAGMAFLAYNVGAGEDDRGGFSEPSFNSLEAQVSMAKASWSQSYWLKRLTFAVEAERKSCVGNEKFVRELRRMIRDEPPANLLIQPSEIEPHGLEP